MHQPYILTCLTTTVSRLCLMSDLEDTCSSSTTNNLKRGVRQRLPHVIDFLKLGLLPC